MRNLLVLPDGTEISSGIGEKNNIRSATLNEYVNSGTELTLGSVCANMLEMRIQNPGGTLNISTGEEVTLYKVDESGTRYKAGLFTLQTPTRPSANLLQFTAYDRVSWLDKDLSSWLDSLDGWPYPMLTFAGMVCEACGLNLISTQIPNGDYPVGRFQSNSATGRKIMGWIGELAARFVRATADGEIEFAWYTPSGITLTPSGTGYRSLSYKDYQVETIDAVRLRLADSDYGMLWPEAPAGSNSYVISGNPLITVINNDLLPYLQVIKEALSGTTYTPCKLMIPASVDIHAGDILNVTDRNGVTITTYVMTKTQKGQTDTMECTGSQRRGSSTAVNNPTTKDLLAYADQASTAAVKRQTQEDVFNKLTNNGQVQGLFLEKDGQVYINASYINSGIMNASLITAGVLQSKDGGKSFRLDLDKGTFSMNGSGKFMSADGRSYIELEGTEFVLYAQAGENGEFTDIARIGYTEDSEGYDYPYMLMGSTVSSGEEFDKLGLYKMFRNGVWLGNSAPRYSTGSFVGLVGAAGIFVDTMNAAAYVVNGMDMEELYHGTVDATFA